MTTSNCAVTDCTNQTHGRTYCGTHRDQKRKGFTPGKAPDRYVDAATVRPLLIKLREKHTVADLGRLLGCSPRTLSSALLPNPRRMERRLAEAIRFASGEHFEPVEHIRQDKTGISGPDAAEYANTPAGLAFIAECRRPKTRKAMAA